MEAEHDFSYLTIRQPSQGSFRDRNSRFLAFAFPVKSEDEVATNLQQLKKQYHDARHFCYAYIIGQDKSRWRANDDGEPSGSAGLPIYNQCLSLDLTNIFVVVVRYFGGTKLGVPGLINAYKTATRLALESAEIISVIPTRRLEIQFSYEMMNTVMSFMKSYELYIISKNFQNDCSVVIEVPVNLENLLSDFLQKYEISFKWL
jgi:uncharacterized YigZ family protein